MVSVTPVFTAVGPVRVYGLPVAVHVVSMLIIPITDVPEPCAETKHIVASAAGTISRAIIKEVKKILPSKHDPHTPCLLGAL